MKISVVIPVWNGREFLEKNLPLLFTAADNSENRILEIIAVDDKSTDSSLEFLEAQKSKIRLIRHRENRGFSAAVNTGVRSAKGKLVCLLNQDVTVSKNFLKRVHHHFRDSKVFAVSLHEAGYGYAVGKFKKGFIIHEPRQSREVAETFWVNGGSGVFRRDLWMELRGMDEALFSPFYWEDIDLSYRALKRGYKLLWEPKAKVEHKHASAIRKLKKRWVRRIQERNQLLFIWKNLTSPNLFRRHIRGLAGRILRHPGYGLIFLMALSKIRVVRKLRRREKKETKISDEAIFSRWT